VGAATPSMGNAIQTAERSTVKLNDPSAAEEIAVDSFPLPSTTVMLSREGTDDMVRVGIGSNVIFPTMVPEEFSVNASVPCERCCRVATWLGGANTTRAPGRTRQTAPPSVSLTVTSKHSTELRQVGSLLRTSPEKSPRWPASNCLIGQKLSSASSSPARASMRQKDRTPSLPPLRSRTGPPPPR
jgi:hypothetical protein